MADAVAAAAATATRSAAQVLTIVAIGCAASQAGLFDADMRARLAKVVTQLLYPVLLLSTAGSFGPAELVRYLPLSALCVAHILIGFTVSWLATGCLRLSSPQREQARTVSGSAVRQQQHVVCRDRRWC